MGKEALYRLQEKGILSHLDIHFALFMGRLAHSQNPDLILASALASSTTRQGHICIDLSELGGRALIDHERGETPLIFPPARDWCRTLGGMPVVGSPGQVKPLILDEKSRLYLYRYWDYQKRLSDLIRLRSDEMNHKIDLDRLDQCLKRLFPASDLKEIDWQKVAAMVALIKRFCVISGGPGTGKTTTIANILAILLEQAGSDGFRIVLTAPTGKAAVRLQETMGIAKKGLNCPEKIREAIPEEASTIHRLLGRLPGSPYFRHNAQNPLAFDLVVVDEASMVDLALMSKLMQALPPKARLILLGDKDQLASVEAGAVLGDICDADNIYRFSPRFCDLMKKVTGYELPREAGGREQGGIQDCIVQLQKNYRFEEGSGIHAVSRAINSGNDEHALSALSGCRHEDIRWNDLPPPGALPRAIRKSIIEGYGDLPRTGDPFEISQRFDRFRVLCALREGPYGVVSLNAIIEKILQDEGHIRLEGRWYAGRPVMITKNDYNLQLFNGDVGITLHDPEEEGHLRVFFHSPDGSLKKFHPVRLPEHETVYAMTVHKSQGSEFDRIMIFLPDMDSPVLTRELIYTAITRAREKVTLWGSQKVFRHGLSRRTRRTSGLRDALWDH